MKKLVCLLLLALSIVNLANAQEVSFNDSKELQLKEVVQAPYLTAKQLFVGAQSMLSDWHPNSNSNLSIDYSDLETGTIITKGKYFMGYHKSNFMYGFNVYANFSLTIRVKEGKAQVNLKVSSLQFHWTAENAADDIVPIEHIYPKYDGYKVNFIGAKKMFTEFGPKVPDTMRTIYKAIETKLMTSDSNDDF